MSSPDSTSSQSTNDSVEQSHSRPPSLRNNRPEPPESLRPPSTASLERPLPELPRAAGSSLSAQSMAGNIRDRPLPIPTSTETTEEREERRRSLIALDRKRRLTNPTYDERRQRTTQPAFREHRSNNDDFGTEGPALPPLRNQALDTPRPPQDVIDLTASSPPLPPLPPPPRENRPSRASSSGSRRYVVPRWQPDAEVSECPICHRAFTFMFRRHHCRKCGRVVCNDCSPHRITIPRQFIVQPPGPDVASSPNGSHRRSGTVDLTIDDEDETSPDGHLGSMSHLLEGGEKVRLCNPCVPDPQPDPLPNYPPVIGVDPRAGGGSWLAGGGSNTPDGFGYRPGGLFSSFGGVNEAITGRTSGTREYRNHQHSYSADPVNSRYSSQPLLPPFGSSMGHMSAQRYRFPPSPNRPFPGHDTVPPAHRGPSFSTSQPPYMESRHARHHSAAVPPTFVGRPRVSSLLEAGSSASRSRPNPAQFLEGPVRPRLQESDICPICRRALPPKGVDGDETAREEHIMECIRLRDPSYQAESGAGPSQARIHMLPFIATEKDCVAHDGNLQECSICMVEYDVGDELARLECLCKFHKECIVQWLGRKAECPVHKTFHDITT